MTLEEVARGPDTGSGPATGPWTIVAAKTEGVQPGLTIRDTAGQTYFIKFDPPSNPEMATAAEVVATKFLFAAGYHVPENYLATVRPESLVIDASAAITEDGRRRTMHQDDVDGVLARSARNADGSYRVVASRQLEGVSVGPFRYYGTRPDDPNDIFPHEHRRELRGLAVFAAWLNHDDSRANNTLDTLVRSGDRTVVRHHLIDFGSAFGSGSTRTQSTRAGNEFVWEARPTIVTMLTLGFYVRPWIKVPYPDIPAVGRFESTYFRPEAWKPAYPNPAFVNARADDRFWAARIVAAFSDEQVRAIVQTGRYSDPRAADYLTDVLLARKSKILNSWLNGTNPIVNPSLTADGMLAFENAAEEAAAGPAAEAYVVEWIPFDNAAGSGKSLGEQRVTSTRAQVPASLMDDRREFLSVRIRAMHHDHPAWAVPAIFYFRRTSSGWSLVGVDRVS